MLKHQNKDVLVCPATTLLFWKLTSGIFYEICNEEGFDNEFGKSFQNYAGDVIRAAVSGMKIYPEEEYYEGKNKKNTGDWVVEDKDSALLIECKAKRVTLLAKAEIKSEEALDKDLDALANAVIQVYKTLADCLKNKYPTFKPNEKKIFPIVITLEDWYFFGDKIITILNAKVKEGFKIYSLSESWLTEMPFSICSIKEFEMMIQIMEKFGIKQFMEKKLLDAERQKWAFYSFIKDQFGEEIKNLKTLFYSDFNKIFPERLLKKETNE